MLYHITNEAVDYSIKPEVDRPATPTLYITEIFIKFSTHPTESENIEAHFIKDGNEELRHILYSANPSTADPDGIDITEIRWSFSERFPLAHKDEIKITYPNTDGNTVTISVVHSYM